MDAGKQEIEKLAKQMAKVDSLDCFIHQHRKNNYALSIAYKIRGKELRDKSRFREALNAHYKSLEYALAAQDTNEIIQAYNNLGTNFRRMGILDEASNNHYTALRYCENRNWAAIWDKPSTMLILGVYWKRKEKQQKPTSITRNL